MKLRDDMRLCSELGTELLALAQHAMREGSIGARDLEASGRRILDAMERAIDRRTPAVPPETPREQCPKCASTGAWTCGEECFYEADEGPPAATPGTAPSDPADETHAERMDRLWGAGTPRGDE